MSSSLRSRLLIVLIAIVSPSRLWIRPIAFRLILRCLIPEQLRRRMLLSLRTQPESARALARGHGRRSLACPSPHPKRPPARSERSGRLRSLLSRIGISLASEFAFVYSAFLSWFLDPL